MILYYDGYVGLLLLLVTLLFIVIIISYSVPLELLFDTLNFQLVITTRVKKRSPFG